MQTGRPTEYRAEFCEQIIELMATGLSLTAASAELGFHRQRAYEWAERHPDFADAIRHAKGKRVAVLERDMLDSTEGPRVTARIFALKNADQVEWNSADRVAIGGDPDNATPIKTESVTDLELARRVAFLLAKGAKDAD